MDGLNGSFVPPPTVSKKHLSIWRVDYNATVAREAAMGWQGLGYVFGLNAALFLVAFVIFQRYAKSTRFSLFGFRSSSVLSARKDDPFTLRKWWVLMWRTPIQDSQIETQLGPEGTFYLMYQVYACRFLLALSVYAVALLLPLYLTLGAYSVSSVAAAAAGTSTLKLGASLPTPTPTPSLATLAAGNASSSSSGAAASALLGPDDRWWSFAHATMFSIPVESPYMWAPVATCYLFTLAFIVFYQKLSQLCSIPRPTPSVPAEPDHELEAHHEEKEPAKPKKRKHLIGMQPSELSARSLFIDRGLPKTLREERLLYLMHEVFPGYVEDVSVVLNLAEFHGYEDARRSQQQTLERERILFELRERGERIPWSLWLLPGSMKYPYLHRLCQCNSKAFKDNERRIQARITQLQEAEHECLQRMIRLNNGAGRAFIIFKTDRLRARFVRRVRNRSIMSILERFPESAMPKLKRYVRELGITRWHMSAAPEPDDIDWNAVSYPFGKRTAVVLLVNLVILVLLFLFTSPVAVTSAISNSTSYSSDAAKSLSDIVASVSDAVEAFSPQMAKMMVTYIPTLILVMINAVLLNVLRIAGRIQPIATDSAKERMILRTAAVYLVFNTVCVPSLAFVSIDAVMLYLRERGEVLDMLGTLFLHNSGIFYVNYVLQRCFLGTAISLLRVSEYFKFCWEKPRAVTAREHVDAVEAWTFFTGTQTAIQISMMTVVLTFSTVVPLILPIGLFYFAMQHVVDKYQLLYVRPRIKGRGSVARTATHATTFSLLIYQGAMSGFFLLRGTKMQSTTVLALLMVTYIVCLWWYVRDKERAYAQTAKSASQQIVGRHCNHPHHQAPKRKRSRGDSMSTANQPPPTLSIVTLPVVDPQAQAPAKQDETTALLAFHSYSNKSFLRGDEAFVTPGRPGDYYREPALRRRRFLGSAASVRDSVGNATGGGGMWKLSPRASGDPSPV